MPLLQRNKGARTYSLLRIRTPKDARDYHDLEEQS